MALVALALPRVTPWLPFTLPFTDSAQDDCTFGPVSNATYRDMLSKARSLQRWKWLGQMPASELSLQFHEIMGNDSSPYMKIAAMHAVLRALGAKFTNNNDHFYVGVNMFEQTSRRGGKISYNYGIAVPRLGMSGLPGTAWMIGSLEGPPSPADLFLNRRDRQGELSFIVHRPSLLDPIPDHVFERITSCPPVPARELEGFFSKPAS